MRGINTGVVHLLVPSEALLTSCRLKDADGRLVDTDPCHREDEESNPNAHNSNVAEALELLHLQVFHDAWAEEKSCEQTANVRRRATEAYEILADFANEDQEQDAPNLDSERHILPMCDEVPAVHTDNTEDTCRKAKKKTVWREDQVRKSTADDAHVEHHSNAHTAMVPLQGHTKKEEREYIRKQVHEAHVGELVQQPPVHLAAPVLTVRACPSENRAAKGEAVQASSRQAAVPQLAALWQAARRKRAG